MAATVLCAVACVLVMLDRGAPNGGEDGRTGAAERGVAPPTVAVAGLPEDGVSASTPEASSASPLQSTAWSGPSLDDGLVTAPSRRVRIDIVITVGPGVHTLCSLDDLRLIVRPGAAEAGGFWVDPDSKGRAEVDVARSDGPRWRVLVGHWSTTGNLGETAFEVHEAADQVTVHVEVVRNLLRWECDLFGLDAYPQHDYPRCTCLLVPRGGDTLPGQLRIVDVEYGSFVRLSGFCSEGGFRMFVDPHWRFPVHAFEVSPGSNEARVEIGAAGALADPSAIDASGWTALRIETSLELAWGGQFDLEGFISPSVSRTGRLTPSPADAWLGAETIHLDAADGTPRLRAVLLVDFDVFGLRRPGDPWQRRGRLTLRRDGSGLYDFVADR